MRFPRAAGILLHPTSLPGGYGIGELGKSAYRFVDFLVESGQALWQILPLGPTGYGDSPYACFSAFAGNPLLIDLAWLASEGDVNPADLEQARRFPTNCVDFGPVISFKTAILQRAARTFRQQAQGERRAAFDEFCADNAEWLEDYALFIALKDAHGGAVWNTWEPELAFREPEALAEWRERLDEAIFAQRYFQYQFFRQWEAVKKYANDNGISIVGDIPIFVAYDSADVWANPELFFLDEDLLPTVVAGVPPDYFSATGQLWGNPLYRWDVLQDQAYAWWIARIRQTFRTVDILRLDHFRGFAAYWAVPAGEPTAINGEWVDGPGAALFKALRDALGELPIIAEDLGRITPDVEELRDQFKFPGMNILQFAFASTSAGSNYSGWYLDRAEILVQPPPAKGSGTAQIDLPLVNAGSTNTYSIVYTADMNLSGKFIVIDGPDGSGKSTQLERLTSLITGLGGRCLRARDPGGTAI
ncbi:MAG: 4-alpha-glucanotransferase, partial [Anaerolineae bacterium]